MAALCTSRRLAAGQRAARGDRPCWADFYREGRWAPSSIGNYLAGRGIPAIAGFGVNYKGLHGTDEWIRLSANNGQGSATPMPPRYRVRGGDAAQSASLRRHSSATVSLSGRPRDGSLQGSSTSAEASPECLETPLTFTCPSRCSPWRVVTFGERNSL